MLNTVEEAIQAIKDGEMIIVTDDEDRENEGDLLMAMEKVTPDKINFMTQFGRGLICAPMGPEHIKRLGLSPMVIQSTDPRGTAFTESIDYKTSQTGISAFERCETLKEMINVNNQAHDFVRPGHIFPLMAKKGGVLERPGHTEAAIDLAQLAGLEAAGVICEIMNEDGHMSRMPDLEVFAEKHQLKMITIKDLQAYLLKGQSLVTMVSSAQLPTQYGVFKVFGFEDTKTGQEHLALVKGSLTQHEPTLVRLHSECLTGDALGSIKCDCGEQLHQAMSDINQAGRGVILYMRQEGRGIGLLNKIKAYHLQDEGLDTVEANLALGFPEDMRDYRVSADILKALGIDQVKLMTNNPDKIEGLSRCGIETVERVPLVIKAKVENQKYMDTKKVKMNHLY